MSRRTFKVESRGIGRRDYSQNVQRFDVEPSLLLFEGFENLPPKWVPYGSLPGYTVVRDTSIAWNGGACLRMTTGTHPTYNAAGMQLHYGIVNSLKLLSDFRIRLPAAGGTFMGIRMDRNLGTIRQQFSCTYDIGNAKWRYQTDPGPFVDVPNGAQSLAPDVFHHVWMGVDYGSAEEYLWLQCNEKRMSLKTFRPWKPADPLLPQAFIYIWGESHVNPNITFYLDNVRVAEVVA